MNYKSCFVVAHSSGESQNFTFYIYIYKCGGKVYLGIKCSML